MKTRRLKAGISRIVHVLAPILKENLENGTKKPMVGIRLESNPGQVRIVQGVEIRGKVTMMPDISNPVPGTGGRAVCVLKTTSPIIIFFDE